MALTYAEREVNIADPGRIAAQIVSGIGFLGAGTIIQARGAVHGLTTAATIWVMAGTLPARKRDALIESMLDLDGVHGVRGNE